MGSPGTLVIINTSGDSIKYELAEFCILNLDRGNPSGYKFEPVCRVL